MERPWDYRPQARSRFSGHGSEACIARRQLRCTLHCAPCADDLRYEADSGRSPGRVHTEGILEYSSLPSRTGLIFDKLTHLDLFHPNFRIEQPGETVAPTLVMAGDHDLIKATHALRLFHTLKHAQLALHRSGCRSRFAARASCACQADHNRIPRGAQQGS